MASKDKSKPKRSASDLPKKNEVLNTASESLEIEQAWRVTGRPKLRKPPKDYDYVEELAHLQFELIKLQEWVRFRGLRVAVLF
jgi:polyphosphate kinase 2 (PPK2 family)